MPQEMKRNQWGIAIPNLVGRKQKVQTLKEVEYLYNWSVFKFSGIIL